MNGYRQGYMPRMQGGQGFFNPWMKGPDIAGGINALTGIIAQRQAMEQAQEQQAWQRGMEEEKLALAEREVAVRERPDEMRIPDWFQQAQMLVKTGQAPDLGKAVRMVRGIRTPEEEAELARMKAEATGTGKFAIKPAQVPSNVKTFTTTLQKGIDRYQGRIDDLGKPPTSSEIAMATFMGTPGNILQQKTSARENMMLAQTELIRIQTDMAETGTLPSEEDLDLASLLLQHAGRAEKEKAFWEKATPEQINDLALEIFNESKKRGIPMSMERARQEAINSLREEVK